MTERPSTPDGGGSSPRRANILAVLVIVIAVLGVVLWSVRDTESGRGGSGPAVEVTGNGSRGTQLAQAVSGLSKAWDDRNKQEFVRAAGVSDDAHAWGRQTYDNLRALGVKEFQARFVAEDAEGIQSNGTFSADVEVTWTPAASSGLATTRTRPTTVQMMFRPSENGYSIEGVRGADDPLPVWLAGDLRVEQRGKADLVYVDEAQGADLPKRLRPNRLLASSKRARRAVREVVGGGVGQAVVVVPRGARQSSALVGRSDLGQIAAVTTTVDGSTKDDAPTYVVLNPTVYGDLGKRAARVVLSHEVTHALTGATASRMPLWVAEGFADYVALHDDRAGTRKSASQILKQVRRKGTPKSLPDDKDFGARRAELGATYEGAWLIFELLHKRAGDEQIVEFYREVRDGTDLRTALEENYGLDVRGLTALWREYLRELAR